MKTFTKIGFSVFLTVFVVVGIIPFDVHAQYSTRGLGSYRSKIEKLDDDAVKSLPIPILFGVTLRNITPNFGDARGGGTRTHEGLDILALKGAPIVSPTEAVVIRTGSGASSGKYVTTANPGGEVFVYMHLSEILVKNGQELKEGDLIGLVGNTGNASGGPAHLHLEIRDGREATDPYPRITKEFALKDKIEFLESAIENVGDEDDFIEFVTANYSRELRSAVSAGIELPEDINDALLTVGTTPATSGASLPAGDLELNSKGPLVVALQNFLITKDTGPRAEELAKAGATGFFGSVTQRALIEYQTENDIVPASGYFGPKTRAYIAAHEK